MQNTTFLHAHALTTQKIFWEQSSISNPNGLKTVPFLSARALTTQKKKIFLGNTTKAKIGSICNQNTTFLYAHALTTQKYFGTIKIRMP